MNFFLAITIFCEIVGGLNISLLILRSSKCFQIDRVCFRVNGVTSMITNSTRLKEILFCFLLNKANICTEVIVISTAISVRIVFTFP